MVKKYLKSNKGIVGSSISFAYFHVWQDDIQDLDSLLGECIVGGCALQLNSNHQGVNLIIPLVLADGRLSFIAIQAKLWRYGLGPTNETTIALLHNQMSFASIFSRVPPPVARPYACILQNLYNPIRELSCSIWKGMEDAEMLPSCLFICGAYSSSMVGGDRCFLTDCSEKSIINVQGMNGLEWEHLEKKKPILRCFYKY